MAGGGNGERPPWVAAAGGEAPPQRPSISLPPRGSMESVFNGGLSPGPMTLLSSFFTDGGGGGGDDYKSFSQLLAGAMASPVAAAGSTCLVDSPSFFPTSQAPLGTSHQQALAQVTAQASSQSHSPMNNIQPQHSFSASATHSTTTFTHVPAATTTTTTNNNQHIMPESNNNSNSNQQRLDPSSLNLDKPADDGYNWRKYGQKQVKGSDFPRSYYKCTCAKCPVKKKVERSLNGHITAIIYKGEHNHQRPNQNNKRCKDVANSSEGSVMQGNVEYNAHHAESTSQATGEQISGTSDSEEVGDQQTEVDDDKNVEPDPKRRNTEVTHSDQASSHRTVTEPRIIVQTTSEVDLLDDGYRWRKYGQKVVKGNPYPRSYYKCTTQGCNVRKHVERASTDPNAVITTYEGKHNHDVPAAKTNSHTIANNTASQLRSQNATSEIHGYGGNRGISANEQHQQPVARLRLKEEQIT